MKNYTIELTGMTCGACEHLIEKVLQRNGARVTEIDATKGMVALECEENSLPSIKQQLAEKGFAERTGQLTERGNIESVIRYISAVITVQPQAEVEARLLNYTIGTTIVLALLTGIVYFLLLGTSQSRSAYASIFALAVITAVSTTYPYIHAQCYNRGISCTNGMMIGMIMGMMPGFMIGALLGATNGMFIGSTIGLIAGIAVGAKVGKCCGVMGAMEGIMAGLMAGIMGAMTSVMMLNDHLIEFLYILFAVCVFVLAGMSYLMHREAGAVPKQEFRASFPAFLLTSIAIWALLIAIMLFGPKGPLTFI